MHCFRSQPAVPVASGFAVGGAVQSMRLGSDHAESPMAAQYSVGSPDLARGCPRAVTIPARTPRSGRHDSRERVASQLQHYRPRAARPSGQCGAQRAGWSFWRPGMGPDGPGYSCPERPPATRTALPRDPCGAGQRSGPVRGTRSQQSNQGTSMHGPECLIPWRRWVRRLMLDLYQSAARCSHRIGPSRALLLALLLASPAICAGLI